MSSEYHVSSLVLHAHQDAIESVRASILALPGADIHAVSPEGKFIVTLEGDSQKSILAGVESMQALEGVLSNSLIYHHVDSIEE